MRKTWRDIEHPYIASCELLGYKLSLGWRIYANIQSHIKHSTGNHTNEFPLGMGRFLKMQPAKYATMR